MTKRILVIQVAALGFEHLVKYLGCDSFHGQKVRPARSVFPGLTCPAQATFRTATNPGSHGMVFNGHYIRELRRPMFWEQSSRLVEGRRIWEGFRGQGGRVGMLFWQQSLGESVDVLLSPAPIHTHGGGLVDAVYSRPDDLYDTISRKVGSPFKLRNYWGPLASNAASRWICAATAALLDMPEERPELLLTYLPHLDYALQRYRPGSLRSRLAFRELVTMLETLHRAAEAADYDVIVFGDYAIGDAKEVVYPNRTLLESGAFRVRKIGARHYPDFHRSDAFAVVDHEVACVFVDDPGDVAGVQAALVDPLGRYDVLDREKMSELGVANPRAGELLLVGRPGTWFAYPWWHDRNEAPDYASHVDIHNKPGYDPCELFFGWPPPSVGQNPNRIKGSHGVADGTREVAWWATWDLGPDIDDLIDLARGVEESLDGTQPG